jgi:hypothetical protein
MRTRLEASKKPGVYYALTADGLELPVIDVTHPAFALAMTDAEQSAAIDAFLAQEQPFAMLPAIVRRLLMRFFLRGSVLAGGIRGARGTFLSGMDTYLFKLGPDNIGAVTAHPIDRRIAEALPAMAMRLRLQDMARLLADALGPELASRPDAPVRLVSIAGGPAMDCLNALRILVREQPRSLEGREVRIDVLDLDVAGPAFGARALAALSVPGAPLHEVHAALRPIRYDWTDTRPLRAVLDEARAAGAVAAGSSEGGLFEYGSDEEITANLACLRDAAPAGFVMAGSVTRADGPTRRLLQTSLAALRPRGLDAFRALVARVGWTVARAIARPFSDQVALVRSSPQPA